MRSARFVTTGLVLFLLPFAAIACDRFKKAEPDAAVEEEPKAEPTVAPTEPAPTEPAATDTPTALPTVPGQPVGPGTVVKTDAGTKDAGIVLDAGALKLDAGALKLDGGAAPIPTPTPTPKMPTLPSGLPTTLPTVLPTTMPSIPGWPKK